MMFSRKHEHKHEAVAVQHASPGAFQSVQTLVLRRCKCGAVSTQQLAGRWNLGQIRGERDLTPAERVEVQLAADEAKAS